TLPPCSGVRRFPALALTTRVARCTARRRQGFGGLTYVPAEAYAKAGAVPGPSKRVLGGPGSAVRHSASLRAAPRPGHGPRLVRLAVDLPRAIVESLIGETYRNPHELSSPSPHRSPCRSVLFHRGARLSASRHGWKNTFDL